MRRLLSALVVSAVLTPLGAALSTPAGAATPPDCRTAQMATVTTALTPRVQGATRTLSWRVVITNRGGWCIVALGYTTVQATAGSDHHGVGSPEIIPMIAVAPQLLGPGQSVAATDTVSGTPPSSKACGDPVAVNGVRLAVYGSSATRVVAVSPTITLCNSTIVNGGTMLLPTAPTCSPSQLSLGAGPAVSAATGEWSLSLAVTNRGGPCRLSGAANLGLYDARGALPFARATHNQYQRFVAALALVMPRGAHVDLLATKYRCDLGVSRQATRATVGISTFSGTAHLTYRGTALRLMGWCKGGASDPGNTLVVGPLVPTLGWVSP